MSEIIGVTLRCGRKVISMDVISDKSKYQRYIKVLGFNSGHSNRVLINSSDKKLVPKKRERVLVKSSNGKGF
jgi:acetone carboxylase gamma subunit